MVLLCSTYSNHNFWLTITLYILENCGKQCFCVFNSPPPPRHQMSIVCCESGYITYIFLLYQGKWFCFFKFTVFIYLYMCTCVHVHMCVIECRRQLSFHHVDSGGSHSTYQVWWQAPLPTEPSCCPEVSDFAVVMIIFSFVLYYAIWNNNEESSNSSSWEAGPGQSLSNRLSQFECAILLWKSPDKTYSCVAYL